MIPRRHVRRARDHFERSRAGGRRLRLDPTVRVPSTLEAAVRDRGYRAAEPFSISIAVEQCDDAYRADRMAENGITNSGKPWLTSPALTQILSGVATGFTLHKQLPSYEKFECSDSLPVIAQCRSALQNRSKIMLFQ